MPSHSGASIDDFSAIVFGSRKSSRLNASATTMASRPSGVNDMLWIDADAELVDHLQCGWVDHPDVVALQVGHVHARQMALHGLAQAAGADLAVQVGSVGH